jgi:hypothetical protein
MKFPITSALMVALACATGAAQAAPAGAESKAAYVQAKDQAAVAYKTARAQCDSLAGNPKDVCVAEAKMNRIRTEQEAEAYYRNTLKAFTQARLRIADAVFARDKTKCAALTGNDKDVCLSQAKATRIATRADAAADKKAIEARNDAREDKREAEYKVAMEKCDAFAGAIKDNCVAAAKAQFAH